MTKLSKQEASHIAYLSRIATDEKNLQELAPHVASVLSYAACVKEIEGSINQNLNLLKENRIRKDEVKIMVKSELLLQEVPAKEGTFIVVPMILEHT